MAERRCVLVVGFPRTGTSWLPKCLSFAPGFTLQYREPDDFDRVREEEKRFINLYLTAGHDNPADKYSAGRAGPGSRAAKRESPDYIHASHLRGVAQPG